MADVDTLARAPHVTVVDHVGIRDGAPRWAFMHFDHSRRTGLEFVRHGDLRARLAGLEAAGRLIGLAWEMHYRPAPDVWRHEFRCPHCSDWSAVVDEDDADGAAWCEGGGTHMDGERLDTRPLTVDQIIAHYQDGGE